METPLDVLSRAASLVHADDEKHTWDEVVPVLKTERGGQEPEQRYRDSGDSASESEAEMETRVS